MKKKLTIFVSTVFSVLLTTASVSAQEVWSLQRCIGYAQENNLSIKQSQAMVRTAQLGESQARASRLPNLSANANLGEQYGRTIDPTSNAFVTSGITFNSLGLNASLPLYQGGRITHSIKQAQHDAQAAEADLAQASNDLALQVAQAYLSILLAKEQVSNAKDQLGLSSSETLKNRSGLRTSLKTTGEFILIFCLSPFNNSDVNMGVVHSRAEELSDLAGVTSTTGEHVDCRLTSFRPGVDANV